MSSSSSSLDATIDALKVPAEFARHNSIDDGDVLARLDEWKKRAHEDLIRLRDIVIARNDSELSVGQQARVVFAAAAFDGEGPWVTTRSLNASRGGPYMQCVCRLIVIFS